MPRSGRFESQLLVQEARAMELFANDVEIAPQGIEAYWRTSANLISLVAEIESFAEMNPEAPADDFELLELRRRLRAVGASLAKLQYEG